MKTLFLILVLALTASAQFTHYSQVSALGSVAERKAYISTLGPSDKADLWHEHLTVSSKFLTTKQKAFITRVSAAITQDSFGSVAGKAELAVFEDEATTLFTDREQRSLIFGVPGAPITAALARLAKPVVTQCAVKAVSFIKAAEEGGSCNCSIGSEFNLCSACVWPLYGCHTNPDDGCGFLGLYRCDGACGKAPLID